MKEGVPDDEPEFKKLLLYVKSVSSIPQRIKRLPDKRKRRSIPLETVVQLVFVSLLLQYESFHMIFSSRVGMKNRWKHCFRGRIPKVDAVRDVLAWTEPEKIREINDAVLDRIYRNGVLRGGRIGG